MQELRLKYVEQLVFQNGMKLVKGVDLELYFISPGFAQNTYLIPFECVHLRTAK